MNLIIRLDIGLWLHTLSFHRISRGVLREASSGSLAAPPMTVTCVSEARLSIKACLAEAGANAAFFFVILISHSVMLYHHFTISYASLQTT